MIRPLLLSAAQSQWCVETLSDSAQLQAIHPQWRTLSEHAQFPNAFFEPWLLSPALHYLKSQSVSLLCIWNNHDRETLLALLPIVKRRRYFFLPLPNTSIWRHPYCFLCTPLLHHEVDNDLLLSILDNTSKRTGMANCFALSWLDGKACFSSDHNSLQSRKWCTFRDAPLKRAGHYIQGTYTDYLATLRTKKRKDLFRSRRRLAEQGNYQVEVVDGSSAQPLRDTLLEEFLQLENTGWKQQQGSSLASNPTHALFFRESVSAGLELQQALIVRLSLDQQPVAMLVVLLSACGRVGYTFKIATDPQFERYSPGSLVILELTEYVYSGTLTPIYLDSCAAPDHPMINSLWRDRLPIRALTLVKKYHWCSPVVALVSIARRVKNRKLRGLQNEP